MISYLVALLIAVAVAGLVLLVGLLLPNRPDVIRRLERMPGGEGIGVVERRRRDAQAERLRELLAALGTRIHGESKGQSEAHRLMVAAGFVKPGAVTVFYGARITSAVLLGALFLVFSPFLGRALGLPQAMIIVIAIWGAALGWVAPTFLVAARGNARKREMLRALPDALDLMVVCVEAGLGLNQALQRVAEEITLISPVLGEQLGLVNLEIRAGTPREEALRAFGTRTDLEDAQSLATVLIQTDRFGTSVAQALRTHADTLRTKRRQRVEEASAKTAIKMLFPLVFCIFPALFIVILGPGILSALKTLGGF
jgi:tight adherence protein C